MATFSRHLGRKNSNLLYQKSTTCILKKKGEALDHYKYFVSHFDGIINLKNNLMHFYIFIVLLFQKLSIGR